MIGYYVHHHGTGHLHRATAVAHELTAAGEQVTGLSSLPRPGGWPGEWVLLPRDDDGGPPVAETAGGTLHWAPLGDPGLRERTAAVSGWVGAAAPRCVVVDVSVEVTLLVRLHGVPVVSVVLPGRRGDAPHLLGLRAADALVGMWPPGAGDMLRDVPHDVLARLRPVGALSRFPVASAGAPRGTAPQRVVVMYGAGGGGPDPDLLAGARAETPGWEWTVLGGEGGTWVEDPGALLREADVVVTHAGQNAVAEVAAARRPAVLVPQERPHQEQRTSAAVLAAGDWPVLVEDAFPAQGWPERLAAAAALDGGRWAGWCDGGAARRFRAVVEETCGRWRAAS